MNLFWRVTAVLGVLLLAAQLAVSIAILKRTPPLPVPALTWGEWRQQMAPETRKRVHDSLPMVMTLTYVEGQPVDVTVKEQPVEVRPVK